MAVQEVRIGGGGRGPGKIPLLLGGLFVLVMVSRWLASLFIEYEWWKEMGQVSTWESIIAYNFLPHLAAALLAFVLLWIAHARGLKHAGTGLSEHRVYARISTFALFGLAALISLAALDAWTIVSFFGSQRAGAGTNPWLDPVFGNPLPFYMFELPFYQELLGLLLAITFFTAAIYWVSSRLWAAMQHSSNWRTEGLRLDFETLRGGLGLEPMLPRVLVFVFLVGLAFRVYLSRYSFLLDDHGFLVGVDYVAANIKIPLVWVAVVLLSLGGLLALIGRWRLAGAAVAVSFVRLLVPPVVSAAYVKPNELALQRPYIANHIAATRSAFGLDSRLKEKQFSAKMESTIDPVKNKPLLDNVRLWDWRAFHDTVTQLQALRQYYVFADTDVDRYTIDGKLRQVMLTPRELDIRQLADARGNWINGHFIYTHGYGVVMAEANRITANGQPVLFIQDAPPKVQPGSPKLTRPELYYGEVTHEPVFVDTQQAEFNYPSGNENVQTRYSGKGGIPVGSFGMRFAAALANGDTNVLLTQYLKPESRMMIRTNVRDRLQTLAGFIEWDADPYLVITDDGHLVWMVDGYTTSSLHPYARSVKLGEAGRVNYIRNSVKATVDAYDGSAKLYVFESNDPVIRAFGAMFPQLFHNVSEMPADLRRHARFPETLFRAQTEIYRTYHMRDPEAFYNREDLWDYAKNVYGQNAQAEAVAPTYIVGTIPGETEPEFLLLQPFTPRSKDNLIGMMIARCDGEKLGELAVLQLSKQSLIYGPLQVEARIDSDQNISKDLSLWNQQGSQVLRGQMLTLPIDDTFLYIEPLYIQSSQTKMPQLKKVVIAMGNTLIYRDTYEQALAELGTGLGKPAAPADTPTAISSEKPPANLPDDGLIRTVRERLRRYRELVAQGKWADAGRELEALEKLAGR